MAQHNLFGTKAEIYGRDFLLNKGYLLLAQNYRYGRSEVDLLMQKKETLICVEVKARSTDFFGSQKNLFLQKKYNF
jgi:putative endonuclease